MSARGGGGALRLVLLNVDSADLYKGDNDYLYFSPICITVASLFERQRHTDTLLTHLSFQMTGAEVVGDAV